MVEGKSCFADSDGDGGCGVCWGAKSYFAVSCGDGGCGGGSWG